MTPPDPGQHDTRPLPATHHGHAPKLLDVRGPVCVQVFLRLRTYSRDKAAGTVIDEHTTDMASIIDMPAWCAITGAAEHEGHDEPRPGVFRHRIRLDERHSPS